MSLVLEEASSRLLARRYVMGTFLSVQLQGASDREAAREAAFEVVQRLEGLLSIFRPESELSRINAAAGISAVRVSSETYRAIDESLHFAALSGGAFDPTVLPLMRQRKSPVVGFRNVVLDRDKGTVFLPEAGMGLDLGGFAKGFALDRALERVGEFPGVTRAFMDFGGQLLCWSREETFAPVRVAIEDPRRPGALLESFEIRRNGSVATSSNAERAGAMHLLDPRTGAPAQAALSATVFAATATEAEVGSTVLFVDGGRAEAALRASASPMAAFWLDTDGKTHRLIDG